MIKNVNLADQQMRLHLKFNFCSCFFSILFVNFQISYNQIFLHRNFSRRQKCVSNGIKSRVGKEENGVTFAFLTSAIFFFCCWRWKQIEINIYVSFNIFFLFLCVLPPPPSQQNFLYTHSFWCFVPLFFILDSCTYILWFSIRITIIIVPWCCLFDKIKKFVELNFYTQILEEWKIHAEGKVFGLKSGVILLFLFALYVDHKLIKDTWILNFVMDFYWHMDVVYAD